MTKPALIPPGPGTVTFIAGGKLTEAPTAAELADAVAAGRAGMPGFLTFDYDLAPQPPDPFAELNPGDTIRMVDADGNHVATGTVQPRKPEPWHDFTITFESEETR